MAYGRIESSPILMGDRCHLIEKIDVQSLNHIEKLSVRQITLVDCRGNRSDAAQFPLDAASFGKAYGEDGKVDLSKQAFKGGVRVCPADHPPFLVNINLTYDLASGTLKSEYDLGDFEKFNPGHIVAAELVLGAKIST